MDAVEFRKLFCGGLNPETNDESLTGYFSKYGNIKTGSVVKHPETKMSRNFGFIEFMDRKDADSAIESGPHTVDGKQIDVKLAVRKDIVDAIKGGITKLFVGGIPRDATREDIIAFFNNHELGVQVKDFILKKDNGQSRGFGFLTPETTHHYAKIAQFQFFDITPESKLEVKIANDPKQQPGGGFRGGMGGPGFRGARGGGRGGAMGRGGFQQATQGYQGAYQAFGNGYDQYGGYGDHYGATAGYGYDQSGYAGFDYGGYNAGGDMYGTQAAAGAGSRGGRGGRGSFHPYSRS